MRKNDIKKMDRVLTVHLFYAVIVISSRIVRRIGHPEMPWFRTGRRISRGEPAWFRIVNRTARLRKPLIRNSGRIFLMLVLAAEGCLREQPVLPGLPDFSDW